MPEPAAPLQREAPSSHPFDAVATRYDAAFTDRVLGRWLRSAVWEQLGTCYHPGDVVLEFGCGTGEDAVWLANRGTRVIATDASTAMLEVARAKAQAAGAHGLIGFAPLDLGAASPDELERTVRAFLSEPEDGLDGAYADFGPLNCLPDRRPLAAALARLVRPGGRLVFVVMGPLCPWEFVWYLLHGHPRSAMRRFRRGVRAHVGDGVVRVWYPSPRRLVAEFAPYFIPVRTVGMGTLLPPSEMGGLVERAPRLFEALRPLDAKLSTRFPGTWLNDHYLTVFERR